MHFRKLSILAVAMGTAFGTTAVAQAPTPPPPSTGTGATPGGLPPNTTIPGTGTTTSPGATGPTAPGAGGTSPGRSAMRGALDFDAIDTDHDGSISRAEASRAGVAGPFTALDKNNDARLDRAEFSAHRGDPARPPGMQSGTSPSTTGTGTTAR
jgi:hypothetical protein